MLLVKKICRLRRNYALPINRNSNCVVWHLKCQQLSNSILWWFFVTFIISLHPHLSVFICVYYIEVAHFQPPKIHLLCMQCICVQCAWMSQTVKKAFQIERKNKKKQFFCCFLDWKFIIPLCSECQSNTKVHRYIYKIEIYIHTRNQRKIIRRRSGWK